MKLDRRDFLMFTGAGVGGLLTGSILTKFALKKYTKSLNDEMSRLSLSPELNRQLDEVVAYRESLGLKGLPPEVPYELQNTTKWDSKPENSQNLLPEKNYSYGERVVEIVDCIFGKNGSRIILGTQADPEYPQGISFNGETRYVHVGDSAHNIPIFRSFTDYCLHEAIGHGSDPAIGALYPPELLVQVEHGKWRALTQCLSIPDQFLNHPGDNMFPLLQKYIGETIGFFVAGNDDSAIVNLESIPVLQEIVATIATQRGKTPQSLKFNKSVCKQIGAEAVKLQRQGKIMFKGKLDDTYQSAMETACVEIYAEMCKYALLYPEVIGNNPDVINGINEVIFAINEDANPEDIHKVLRTPGDEIVNRYKAEEQALSVENTSSFPTPTLSAEDLEKLRKEEEERKLIEQRFNNFAITGEAPDSLNLREDQQEYFTNFAKSYCQIIGKYPSLKDTFAQQYKEEFDPDLHVWEIRQIEEALDSGFVRDVLAQENISDEKFNDICSRAAVLEKFVNSPTF